MFRNAILYRIGAGRPGSAEQLAQLLERDKFRPCGPSQAKSSGWTPPRGHAHGALIESINGQWIGRFVVETKNVPGVEVSRKAQESADQIEKTTGRKPGKKEARELRDDALLALLPRAFPRQTAIWMWIDPKDGLLVLDATNQRKADDAISSLARVLGQGLQIGLVQTRHAPAACMAEWLSDGGDGQIEGIDIGRACELKAAGDAPARVRLDHHDLCTEEVRQHIRDGKWPTTLGIEWRGYVSLVLTHQLHLRRIRLMDGAFDAVGTSTDNDSFDVDVTAIAGTLRLLIDDLVGAMGGESA
ncbi:MAG: recombination-associated protein RdgC [Burkholderiaceae bacterium]|jgi:recombination associated protein RdgC|nr:recombination-associated protein RdgC [Burkholderiaceae bacterium]